MIRYVRHSRAYAKARQFCVNLIARPQELRATLTRLKHKLDDDLPTSISKLGDSCKVVFRLVQNYYRGEYRQISKESVILLLASLVYFLMPLDAIPDFLLGYGYADDAALLAWTFHYLQKDIEQYILWEHEKASDNGSETERLQPHN